MIMIPLRIISSYTGDLTLEDALKNPRSVRLLWLEILFNDELPWEAHLGDPLIRSAYEKACTWYGQFKTLIKGHTGRKALPGRDGTIDMREHRRFLEALNLVTTRT